MPKSKGYSELARELGVSRQRIWQLMKKIGGVCPTCGKPRTKNLYKTKNIYNLYCEKHRADHAKQVSKYYQEKEK